MLLNNKRRSKEDILKYQEGIFSANYYIVYAYALSYFQLHFYFLMLYESFAGVQMCIHKCCISIGKGDVDIE